jgi:UrcA family protein
MAAAAMGQSQSAASASEEVTVLGHRGAANVPSLAYPVTWHDLDLRKKESRDELRRRIEVTATTLCKKLGEDTSGGGVVPSCHDQAVREAVAKAEVAEKEATTKTTPFVAGPAWVPPSE